MEFAWLSHEQGKRKIENQKLKTARKPQAMKLNSTMSRSWKRMSKIGTKEFVVESQHSTNDTASTVLHTFLQSKIVEKGDWED